jgi:predicted nucleotidyltransferase
MTTEHIATNDVDESALREMAERLVSIDGVAGVALGGSRARGAHAPGSDVDLGLYLHGGLDVAGLRELAREVTGQDVDVTERGGWGPWVDGGGWLVVDGIHVDWLYRDLARIDAIWEHVRQGRFAFHAQAGHPFGFLDAAYCGELALGRVLSDPTRALAARQERMRVMPGALGDALAARIWEASFTVENALKGATRGDVVYVLQCLSHALLIAAHAIHGRDRAWSTNEKGLIAAAGRLPHAPEEFVGRAHSALAVGAATPDELLAAIDRAAALVAEVERAIDR